jgi:Ca2+-binding RTX toxin-like protein
MPTFSGTPGDDELIGTAGDDLMSGFAGLDTLVGKGGSDELHGGDGSDFLFAGDVSFDNGTDVDRLDGGDGLDFLYVGYGDFADGGAGGFDAVYISYAGSPGPVDEDLSALLHGAPLMPGAVQLSNIERIGGVALSRFDDRLVVGGDMRGVDILAGAGDDRIIGQGGPGDAPDWTGFRAFGEEGNDVLLGSFNGDFLIGGAGADTLVGGAGNDELSSDRGAIGDGAIEVDRLFGGAGDDFLFFGWGDEVDGGGGFDTATVSFAGAAGGVTADTGLLFQGIERLFSLTLSDGADRVVVGTTEGGAALILAGNGNDQIIGQQSAIHVDGGAGGDLLVGSTADDLLVGADGEDRLLGGAGNDILWGGRASDIFYLTHPGTDVIADFSRGEDKIDVSGLDADSATAGHQRFTFIGDRDFSAHAGELRAQVEANGDHGEARTYSLAGDVDGDGHADFLFLLGIVHVEASDIIF